MFRSVGRLVYCGMGWYGIVCFVARLSNLELSRKVVVRASELVWCYLSLVMPRACPELYPELPYLLVLYPGILPYPILPFPTVPPYPTTVPPFHRTTLPPLPTYSGYLVPIVLPTQRPQRPPSSTFVPCR